MVNSRKQNIFLNQTREWYGERRRKAIEFRNQSIDFLEENTMMAWKICFRMIFDQNEKKKKSK